MLIFCRDQSNHLNDHPRPEGVDIHHRYVWIMSVKGDGRVCLDTEIHHLIPGNSILIRPFQTHFYMDVRPRSICWVFVTFEHEPNIKLEKIHAQGAQQVSISIVPYVLDLLTSWSKSKDRGACPPLLSLIFEKSFLQASPKPIVKNKQEAADDHFVSKINQYGIENRHRPVAIPELAEILGMSSSSLRTRFQSLTGLTIGRHLRDLKLSYACELLYEEKLQISEIAERCGYDSPFVFSRAFRNHFHCTPSDYRTRSEQPLPIPSNPENS